ncbi:MAG: hypothetical protein WAM51_03475 [Methylovirgula sp.]
MRARIPLAAAMTLAAFPAFAAGTDSVNVPIGALAGQVLSVLEPLVLSLLGATLTWLMAKLGPDIAKSLHAARVDREIARAVDTGFGLVEGAEKGKVLEVPIANKVIRKAAQCLVDEAPGLFKELGESLGPILVAKLSASGALPPGASAGNLDLNPYVDVKKEAAG